MKSNKIDDEVSNQRLRVAVWVGLVVCAFAALLVGLAMEYKTYEPCGHTPGTADCAKEKP